MSGFFFQQRTGRIDLKQLSDIDIDRVVRETDIDLLQLNLENLTFRHLDLDDLTFFPNDSYKECFGKPFNFT